MNNARLNGLRQIGSMGFDFGPRLIIAKTERGWEAYRGDKLVGVCQTREGAKELLGAL